jgi:transcriptional regulator with XRE-family HTH domain
MQINKEKLQRFPVQDPEALVRTLRPLPLRQRMATLRSLFNLSQEEASQAVNRKRNAWSNWEAEEDNPRRSVPGASSRAALGYVFGLPQSLFVDD